MLIHEWRILLRAFCPDSTVLGCRRMIWQLAFYLLAVTKEYEIMKQRNSVSDDEHILMARIIYKIGMESSQQLSWGRYDDFLSIDFDQFQRYTIYIYIVIVMRKSKAQTEMATIPSNCREIPNSVVPLLTPDNWSIPWHHHTHTHTLRLVVVVYLQEMENIPDTWSMLCHCHADYKI